MIDPQVKNRMPYTVTIYPSGERDKFYESDSGTPYESKAYMAPIRSVNRGEVETVTGGFNIALADAPDLKIGDRIELPDNFVELAEKKFYVQSITKRDEFPGLEHVVAGIAS